MLLVKGLAYVSSKDERVASQQLARCCHSAGDCWKKNYLPPFVGRSLFLYACVVPFSCQRPLGVSAYFNHFLFLIQLNFFLNLFNHSQHKYMWHSEKIHKKKTKKNHKKLNNTCNWTNNKYKTLNPFSIITRFLNNNQ